jgi:hypothetical protein
MPLHEGKYLVDCGIRVYCCKKCNRPVRYSKNLGGALMLWCETCKAWRSNPAKHCFYLEYVPNLLYVDKSELKALIGIQKITGAKIE